MTSWIKLVYLGDSALMLPAAAVIAAWLASGRAPRLAASWGLLFMLGLALVGMSKIAFLGWGWGLPSIDLKGFSGHAMRTTAVMPVLLYLLLQPAPATLRRIGVALGLLAGAAMGVLLVVYDYHSISESVAGWLIGAAVSLCFIRIAAASPAVALHPWFIPVCLVAFLGMRTLLPHSTTHVLNQAAMFLSGSDTTYKWDTWKKGC